MSLLNKIFAAFIVMAGLAVVGGVAGWRTVERIDDTMNRIVEYELTAESKMNSMDGVFQALTVAQRTLLNTSLPPGQRDEQHKVIQDRVEELNRVSDEVSALLEQGVGKVAGWETVRSEWKAFQEVWRKYAKSTAEGVEKLRTWEGTTILNPDVLLRDIMRYRGDHYQLASRLGLMISEGHDSGPDISPADNLCNFGRWRERFESGEEVFSRNPQLRRAMEVMTEPHREFHKSAADVQALLRQSGEKNAARIAQRYKEHLAAAAKVIETFDMIADEAERARRLYAEAESFTMGVLRSDRDAALVSLENLLAHSMHNLDENLHASLVAGEAGAATMRIVAGTAFLLGLLTLVYLFWTIRRQLTRPLARVIASLSSDADGVAGEAHSVAASSESLSQGAGSQSAALEETSAALEEISSVARKIWTTPDRRTRTCRKTRTKYAGLPSRSTKCLGPWMRCGIRLRKSAAF